MAQTKIAAGSGFDIEGDIGEATSEDDDSPKTVEEELALKIITRLRQGFPKAAMAHAVELTNRIARKNDLSGGAWE